jgi:U3 small nucleolar RNA-associated protein 14
MTHDGTNVDPEELRKFSKGAHDRAENATSAAEAVEGVHMGPGMLGLFSLFFLDDASNNQREIVSKVRAAAAALSADGAIATTNAGEVENLDQAHADGVTYREPQ